MNLSVQILKYILIGLFSLTIFSCDDIGPSILVEGDKVEVEFEILPTYNIGYQVFSESTSEVDLDSILGSNNSSIDDIKSIYITNITLSILNEDTSINFNNFNEVEAILSTNTDPEILIGYLSTISPNSRNLVCKYTDRDLLEYLDDSVFYLQAKGINNSVITDTILVKGVIETEVSRRIL